MTEIGGVRVAPTNLELLTEEEARAVQQTYKQLVDQLDYPVTVYSVQSQLNLFPYAEYVKDRFSIHRELWEDYLQYCSQVETDSIYATDHYILSPVEPSTQSALGFLNEEKEDLEAEAERRETQITEALNTTNLSAKPVTDEELEGLTDRFTGSYSYKHANTGNSYRRFLVITEYPSQLELGWPLDLLRIEGQVDVIQHIRPRDGGKTRGRLNKVKEQLNAEINSRVAGGFVDTNKLESKLGSTEQMLDSLAQREQHPFDYLVLISVSGETREECDSVFQKLQSRLKMMGIKTEEPVLRIDQAAKTCTPTESNPVNEHYLLLSNAVSAGFPFATRTIDQASGIIYGEDTFDNTPILQNRFNWHAPHLARFGATGSGKTYHTKIELLRTRLTHPRAQIIVIDPKNEYHGLTGKLRGTTYNVTDRPETLDSPACFQVPERGQTRYIDSIIDLIEHLYQVTSQSQDKTLVVADEAHNVSGVGRGRQILTRWVREARDTNTAITVVSQSASDFTQYEEGRTLLDQCPGKVFFRHQRVSDDIVDHFKLSEQEVIDLYNLKTGTESPYSEAILKISGRLDAKIRVEATPAEHRLIEQ
jgi:hypothetical protein